MNGKYLSPLFSKFECTAGLGIIPFILLFRVLELQAKRILTTQRAIVIVLVCLAVSLVWQVLTSKIFHNFKPQPVQMIKGALAEVYIGLPMTYYFLATPKEISYITSSDSFFGDI